MQINLFWKTYKKNREDWLDSCRAAARKLLLTRYSITSEDVTELVPRPENVHHNATGSIFRDDDFTSVGYTLTRRTTSHRRLIRKWGLKNPPYGPSPKRVIRPKEYDSGD